MPSIQISRRQVLQQASIFASLGLTVPSFLDVTAKALESQASGARSERILVLVQLAGGNDGLNTLVPYADDVYYRARPKLGIPKNDVHRIDDYAGFHPEMYAIKDLWDEGLLSVVQNVGYPNPDRSHFRSTEIWETGSPSDENWTSGWLGRYFDNECGGDASPLLALQFGDRAAQTFSGKRQRCVTLSNPDLFQFSGGDTIKQDLKRLHSIPENDHVSKIGNPTLDFMRRTGNDMLHASQLIVDAVKTQKTTTEYLPFQFSQSLKMIAQMIAAEVPTRVFYVSLTGFDHHATQSMRHATLLQELSEGLSSFVTDLKQLGCLDRTLVMTFSEFGRRVAENQSEGTDHGTANMMFVAGGTSKAGLHGARPDLSALDPVGDLVHAIDFRSIYASVLSQWLGADPGLVMGSEVSPIPGLLV
jgi:uncharacterized protein (DUF1501 family)